MTPSEVMARAGAAQRLLDDPMLKESFQAIEADCLAQWKATPARDTEGREWLWMMIKVIERLRGHLEGIVQSGIVAAENLRLADEHRKFVERNYPSEETHV